MKKIFYPLSIGLISLISVLASIANERVASACILGTPIETGRYGAVCAEVHPISPYLSENINDVVTIVRGWNEIRLIKASRTEERLESPVVGPKVCPHVEQILAINIKKKHLIVVLHRCESRNEGSGLYPAVYIDDGAGYVYKRDISNKLMDLSGKEIGIHLLDVAKEALSDIID